MPFPRRRRREAGGQGRTDRDRAPAPTPYTSDDFGALYAMRSDAEVARYLHWSAQTEDEVRRDAATKIASTRIDAEGDVLALAAEHRLTQELVADVILHWVSREHGLAEVGYVVHPDHAGRGYATEATRPLLAVAFDALRLHRVIGRTGVAATPAPRAFSRSSACAERRISSRTSSSRTNGRASSSTPSSTASGARAPERQEQARGL